jgi:hypothetical protein
MRRRAIRLVASCWSMGLLACVEGGNLAISAGAPVTAAVRGRITECGRAVPDAEVLLAVQQDLEEQARPVNIRSGPVTTGRDGGYFMDVSPSFAVPGPASMLLLVTTEGRTHQIDGGTLELRLGVPARDTARFDADLGSERGSCREEWARAAQSWAPDLQKIARWISAPEPLGQ